MLSRIQGHPNIVTLVENIPNCTVLSPEGELIEVDYAMVIEPLRGGELSYNLSKFGQLPASLAHYFFKQIASAISHMHQAGVAHRDLKPWNVMLCDDLASAKVIDFSYATPLCLEELSNLPATEILSGWLSGTP